MPRPLPGDPGAAAAGGGGSSLFGLLFGWLANPTLLSALLSCAAAQVAKPLAHAGLVGPNGELTWGSFSYAHVDWGWMGRPGGMPSSHASTVVGATTALGLVAGTDSATFALAVVTAMIVMYDATGVRLHAGQHASVLNLLVKELPDEHPAADVTLLQETLGHTPAQVAAGAVLGFTVAVVFVCAWRLVVGG